VRDAYMKMYGQPNVKNMNDQDAVRDAYMKKYSQKYQDEYMPHIKNKSDPNEWSKAYKKKYVNEYAKQYMKDYDGEKKLGKNATQKEQAKYYTEKYAGAYEKYIKENMEKNKADEEKKAREDKTEKKDAVPEEKEAQTDKLADDATAPRKESVSEKVSRAPKKAPQAPAQGSSWPLSETEAAATPETLSSVVDAEPTGFPFAFAAFAAALLMVPIGVFVRRRLQQTAGSEGPDMYSAYAPLV